MRRISSLLFLMLALASTVVYAKDKAWTQEFDPHFRKYAKRYFGPNVDWKWFKAQGIAESALKHDAHSKAGAKGIMQILPSTFEEIQIKNPQFANIEDVRWNIAAGIYYDRQLYRRMTDVPSFQNRLYMTFASYNAGYGRILKAIKRAQISRDVANWKRLRKHMPGETRNYVTRIIDLKRNDLRRD